MYRCFSTGDAMRFLIAPDAFKGTLKAAQAAEAMAAGIRHIIPSAEIESLPLADGGEGTMDVLISHLSHEHNYITNDEYVIYNDDYGENIALIESARHLGLTRPDMQALDALGRSSRALGNCIRHALDAGIRRFVIGLGGSATNDSGLGMLVSLGLCALDNLGRTVTPNLCGLLQVHALDVSGMDPRLGDCHYTILCDVDAPLYGTKGATCTFGPQKGLPATDIESIDLAMERFAGLAEKAFGRSVSKSPGSGAAGGLGFALALLGGDLVSGADYVIEKAGLIDKLYGADWVITGEGKSDMQTLAGKLPLKVAGLARAHGLRVALISGDIMDEAALRGHFDDIVSARPAHMSAAEAMDRAEVLLREAVVAWAAELQGG